MSIPKPKVRGYVVDHKESKVRYAVSADNFNDKIHELVRPLKQSETVRGYIPKAVTARGPESSKDDAKASPASSNTRK